MERLSTGFRINSSKDDAANCAIATSFTVQLSSWEVVQNNASFGQAMLDTADGTLDSIQNMLSKVRNLALESLNGTYSSNEREAMQNEASTLVSEIYRVKNSATFNTKKIFSPEKITPISEEEAVEQGYTVVKTAQELKNALKVNDANCKVMLFDDINLDDLGVDETGSNWVAVGTNSKRFKGALDGNSFSISNLKINKEDSNYQGLFGYIDGATIKNVEVDNVDVKGKSEVGGLIGYNNNSTIENCTSSGSVKGSGNEIGGLVGQNNNSTIENCASSGNVTGSSGGNTGGLVGLNSGSTIENCASSGSVTGKVRTGGLVGYNNNNSTINNCTSSGNIAGNGNNTGGLVGLNSGSTIENCASSGNVKGDSDFTGGFVGYNGNNSTIENCSSSGSVTGKVRTGGLVGYNYNNSTIENCASSGSVTADGLYAGGLVGWNNNNSTIENCSSSGNITGDGITGGLVGTNQGNSTITNSRTTSSVTGKTSTGAFIGSYTDGELSENEYNSTINVGMKAISSKAENPPEEQIKDNTELIITDENSGFDKSKVTVYPDKLGPSWDSEESESSSNTKIYLQIGIDADSSSGVEFETDFSLGYLNVNLTTEFGAKKALERVDKILNKVLSRKSELGAVQNKLDSIIESQTQQKTSLYQARSIIKDTDFAQESSNFIKFQILQQATASLLSAANQTPNIALALLGNIK